MQTEKNLPQPLLVKEGKKKHHYLSGNGSRWPGEDRSAPQECLATGFKIP